ncbi:MAG: TraR/DksA family transcriptional regulator [Acidobacteria bacterium]|nr:TraR/DksA family transcriptional regulator [Acidobacteriota bacterium]
MAEKNTQKYEAALRSKAQELAESLRDRSRIAIEQSAEACEVMVMAANRELNILGLDRDSRMAREVQAALARLQNGSYGNCLRCEEPIKPKRLEVVPWARHCVSCQEMLEQEQNEDDAQEELHDLIAA